MTKSQSSEERKRLLRERAEIESALNINKHHILFEKSIWCSCAGDELRCDHHLIIPMDRQVHADLHQELSPIPPLGKNMTGRLISLYRNILNGSDTGQYKCATVLASLVGIQALNLALEQLRDGSGVVPLERKQINLMKENLLLQMKFIKRSNAILRHRQASLATTNRKVLALAI